MKKLLLSAAFLMSLCASAQDPIYAFYSEEGFMMEGGPDINHYVLVTSGSPLDQTASGPNMDWNFNDLSVVTQTTTTVVNPSSQVLTDYPGTTLVVETTTEGGNPTHYYLAQGVGGQTSLTGAETSQMTIKYDDFALIGFFPMDYEDSATSNVSGTFEGQGFEGTFTGSTSSIVDAYGTLTVNEGFEGTKSVTRLRTNQDLVLNYMGFPVGTLQQTTYSYYNADLISGPVFRSITTHISVPALSIDQTQSTLESYVQTTNATAQFNANARAAIAPNPVKDMLHIAGNDGIESVTIIDAAGRAILNAKGNDVQVSHLPAGVYQVMIGSQSGSKSLKMVKL